MKKLGIMNGSISAVVANLEHTDMLIIGDAGLPGLATPHCIGISLKPGVPGLLETLEVVLKEMYVEKAYVYEDILIKSPTIHEELQKILGNVPIESIKHLEFKKLTRSTKAIIRTTEYTPCSNIILVAGTWGFSL